MTAAIDRIYLDNAATTAIDPEVVDAMLPYLTTHFGNPSSIYSYGRETRIAIEKARKSVAKILGAHPSEIFFTSGGTESSNTAILRSVVDLGCTQIISSPIEHHATLHAVQAVSKQFNLPLHWVKIDALGAVDYTHLENLIAAHKGKTLVSLMHANNEIGTILDINLVGEICKKYQAIFHSDTVQTVGHYPFNLRDTPVHFINGASHKFHGPKGVGLFYINENITIKPLIEGGSQERNMRAGTENIYGIVGFAKALEMATERHEADAKYIRNLKNYMHKKLVENVNEVSFNGDLSDKSLYTVLSANFDKSEKTEMLLFNLDINNICASGGSACTSGVEAGSHVIKAINNNPNKITVRFSFSRNNNTAEIDTVVAKLKEHL
jgi:cysteine desulfurase